MQCYREYLASQAEEEKKKEKELDALVNEEVQKQWAKRVEQWRKEREARKKLVQDVLDTRKKQIQERCEYTPPWYYRAIGFGTFSFCVIIISWVHNKTQHDLWGGRCPIFDMK